MMRLAEGFNHWGEKIAAAFGEKNQWGVSTQRPAALFTEVKSLSSLLPYEAYDAENCIFINQKSIGFILEASPMTGCTEEIENILASLLTDVLPVEADLQCLLWASPKIGAVLDAFEKARSGQGEIFEKLAKARTAFLKQEKQDGAVLRDFKLYWALSLPKKDTISQIEQLIALREDFQSTLKSISMPSRNVPIDDFINLMSDLLNPSSDCDASNRVWNPLESLNLQLTDPEQQLRVYKNRLCFDTDSEAWEARALMVCQFPMMSTQWRMNEAIGQLFNSALQISCPFVISWSLRSIDPEKATSMAQMKFINKDSTARSPLAKFKPNADKESRDWHHAREQINEGNRLVQLFYQVILYAPATEAASCERKLRDLYRANGWRLSKSSCLQLQSWLAMLPMMMSEGLFSDLKIFGRLRTLTAFNAMTLAPLQGEWKGTARPSLLLPGRRGQVALWNPFDNTEGNYNVAIAAKSGSGKSVFTQEYIVSLVGSGGRVWVIDVGRSYEKTCKLLGGEFIEFTPDKSISLNPFTFISNFESSLELLKPLTAAMARPTGHTSDEEVAWIEKALKMAWKLKGTAASMTTVTEWLYEQTDPVCKNLAHLLYPYTIDGMYGRYFEGPCSIHIENPFVVLELEELKAKKDLQKIMLLVLMYQISERMYLGNRLQMKSCIIDEAWDLLGGDHEGAAKFIETGYRRARRYNANFVTITQSINDYFKNATSIAAYENSDNNIILGQKSESIEALKTSKRLNMDSFTERLFKSLRKTDDYSECVIKGPAGLSVHRILLDPYARILYSSKGDEFEAVKSHQAQGKSLFDSIAAVAKKFTNGVAYDQ